MNINYRETWNELCFHINGNRNYLERDFQKIIEFYLFEKLGWSKYKGEIVSQKSISIGSANSVNPDIIINKEGNNVLVVELKRATQSISLRNTEQLISYMRLLRLNLGLLIGDTFQIYYDNPNDNKDPIKVLEIPFEVDDTEGITLIELLSKDNFSNEKLEEYSISHLSRIAEIENINKYINLLCSEKGKEIVLELLREKLLEEFSEKATTEILNQVVLNISRKEELVVNTFENKYDGEGFTHSEMNDRRSIKQDVRADGSNKRVIQKLNSIGKKVFINILYLEILNNRDVTSKEIVDKYPTYGEYTLKSQSSRLSKAKSIFKEDLVIDALKIIAESRAEGSDKAIYYLDSYKNIK